MRSSCCAVVGVAVSLLASACGEMAVNCRTTADCASSQVCGAGCTCAMPGAAVGSCASAGGGAAGGSTAGGVSAGGSSAGGAAGGAAGGSSAGGVAGGASAGGVAGGSTAGGAAGGSTAGGTAGGSTAGGVAGGSTAGGTAGGSSAGGSAGGSSTGGSGVGPDGGLVCGTPTPLTTWFLEPNDAGALLTDLVARPGGLALLFTTAGQSSLHLVELSSSGHDAGTRTFGPHVLLGRAAVAFDDHGTMGAAWTPTDSSLMTQFFPLVGPPSAATYSGLTEDFDSVDLAWHPTAREFASFNVDAVFGGVLPTTITMQRWAPDGGRLGQSQPIVRGFVTMRRNAVIATPTGYLVATSGTLSHTPADGGTATIGATFPGAIIRAVANGADDVGVLYRAGDGGTLWFNRVARDGTGPLQTSTLIDPGSNLYGRLAFDGQRWRVAFQHRPTQQPWLATLSATGALEALTPLSCEPDFWYPSIAPLGAGRVAIGLRRVDSSQVVVTP